MFFFLQLLFPHSQYSPSPDFGKTVKLLTYPVPSVLLVGGGRDGISIVATEEYERAFQSGREVEAGMGVSLASGSFSKVADDRAV